MDQYHVLKKIRTDRLGDVRPGKIVPLPDVVAKEYLRTGAVERYETKVIKSAPLSDAGEVTPSSALPAAPVLPSTTSKPLKRGGRPRKNVQ
jgi:hypothetical protein